MKRPLTNKRKITILLGLAVLLLSILSIFRTQHPQWIANILPNERHESVSHVKDGSDDANAKQSKRQLLGEAQIATRVHSMLNLPDSEVGMIAISHKDVEQVIHSIMPNWMDNGTDSKIRFAEVSQSAISKELEALLKRGCRLQSKFGDPGMIHFSGEDLNLNLMMSSEVQPGQAELQLMLKHNDFTQTSSISMNKSHILLVSPSAPNASAILIVVGSESTSPTENKK